MSKITESTIEKFAIELLERQGCQYIYAPSIAPGYRGNNRIANPI